MTKVGKRITELRKEKNWSQDKLAEKLDVTRQTIYNWESGSVAPTADKLAELSKLFKVSVGSFFDEEIAIADATPQNVSKGQETPSGAGLPTQQEERKVQRNAKALKIALLSFCGVGIIILSLWLAIMGTALFSNRGDDQAASSDWGMTPKDAFILILIVLIILFAVFIVYWIIRAIRKKKSNVKDNLQDVKDSLHKK